MHCREAEDLYGAYVLGALGKREREKVASHLDKCASCSLELRADTHVVSGLAQAIPQVEAPRTLKTSLMARIEAESSPGLGETIANAIRNLGNTLIRPSWTMAGAYAGATAAIAIAVVSMVWLNDVAGDTQVLQQQADARAQDEALAMANVENRLDEMANKVETVANVGTRIDAVIAEQSALASRVQTVATYGSDMMDMVKDTRYLTYMAATPDTAVNMISSDEATGQAHGMMLIAPSRTWGLLAVLELPPLPEGKVYQAWLIDGGTIIDAGIFLVDETGYGQVVVQFPDNPDLYDNVGITIEPEGGSPFPTSDTVLLGDF